MKLPAAKMPQTAPSTDLEPESWVDLYGDALYGYALARLHDPSVAEELVQETFLAALAGLSHFQGRSSVRTWLTGILKHKIIDHLREKYREGLRQQVAPDGRTREGFFDEHGAWKHKPTRWSADPHRLVQQRQFMETLFACLAELSDRASRAFILREMEGLTTGELCKLLDISATNCWVILHRARMKLRRCLEINWFERAEEEAP